MGQYRVALLQGFRSAGIGRNRLRVAPRGAFHEPVQRFRPIWRVQMIAPGFGSDLDDLVLGQTEILDPTPDVQPRWPALPPGGQGGVGFEAQRRQQLCEEPIKINFARSCVLLLLYWFT